MLKGFLKFELSLSGFLELEFAFVLALLAAQFVHPPLDPRSKFSFDTMSHLLMSLLLHLQSSLF